VTKENTTIVVVDSGLEWACGDDGQHKLTIRLSCDASETATIADLMGKVDETRVSVEDLVKQYLLDRCGIDGTLGTEEYMVESQKISNELVRIAATILDRARRCKIVLPNDWTV
jgi:hypothetical protein